VGATGVHLGKKAVRWEQGERCSPSRHEIHPENAFVEMVSSPWERVIRFHDHRSEQVYAKGWAAAGTGNSFIGVDVQSVM
jgi:hypothetical protein